MLQLFKFPTVSSVAASADVGDHQVPKDEIPDFSKGDICLITCLKYSKDDLPELLASNTEMFRRYTPDGPVTLTQFGNEATIQDAGWLIMTADYELGHRINTVGQAIIESELFDQIVGYDLITGQFI